MHPSVDEQFEGALARHRDGHLLEAEAGYRAVLGEEPRHADASQLLGVVLTQTGRAAEGADRMRQSLALKPDQPMVYANLGHALGALGEHPEALVAYERALVMLPGCVPALNGRGNVLARLGRWQEAIDSYRRTLHVMPDLAEAHTNLGLALAQLDRLDEAVQSYDRALALAPRHINALIARGQACIARRRYRAALTDFDAALALQPNQPMALFLRGRGLMELGRPGEAAACFQRTLELDPHYEFAQGALLWAQLHAGVWEGHEQLVQRLQRSVSEDRLAAAPFMFFCAGDSPELQLRCARRFAAHHRPDVQPLYRGERYRHDRIRLAYVSEDFRGHPMAYLMMGLWEHHDRRRFETIAVSLRPAEDSSVGRRAKSAFEHFIDVSAMADADIARRMRELEIDIAVDLMGYTGGRFRSLFCRRPAPIQVSYIGYPGTLGSGDADYLLADEFLVPEAHRPYFSEQVVYLPGTYQPNDDRRAVAQAPPSREEAGLPLGAFVWCSFNHNYKLNPRLFDVWCNLLCQVPHSVLWLIPSAAESEINLRHELTARRVDPVRLVFAPSTPNPEHLARIALADLCLDTAPVSGMTTTSDALWAGVPVVTCAGRSFVSRMAGSVLKGAGLSELITSSWPEYEELALALARDPARLARLRAKLASVKSRSALFDTDRARRNVEAAYLAMWQRHQRGEPPRAFTVVEDPHTPM